MQVFIVYSQCGDYDPIRVEGVYSNEEAANAAAAAITDDGEDWGPHRWTGWVQAVPLQDTFKP